MSATNTLELPGYQVLEYLGSGARSTIWRIRDRRTDEILALKRVVKRSSSDHRFIEQAENEYAIASQLSQENIRRILRMRRLRRLIWTREVHLIMEYCPGETVQQRRPTDVAETVRVFLQVTMALGYMHRCGFVHADTKPNNIIMGAEGQVKIIDFGQSCPIGTIKQRIQGTPDFIAPEQVYRQPLDARTDVFNFGAALYWALTGQAINTVLPRKTSSIQLRSDLQLKPVDELNPDVPPALAKLVADCVEYHVRRRPESMQQVQAKLELIETQLKRVAQNGPADESKPQ